MRVWPSKPAPWVARLRRHHNIDGFDLAIAATAIRTGARLLTRNVRHFPMFPGLQAPY
jgi:predicted nucleic acid-binding protein